MELGSGIALGSLCVSAGAVAIAAIRANSKKNGKSGTDFFYPCKEHSGLVVCLEGIEKNQESQERWLNEISSDVKNLLKRK